MRTRRALILTISVLLSSCAAGARDGGTPVTPESENIRRLAAILDYVAADYGGAVEDGKVTNEGEYEEQRSFMKDAAAFAEKVGGAQVVSGVRSVAALVDGKAPAGSWPPRRASSAAAFSRRTAWSWRRARRRPASAPRLCTGIPAPAATGPPAAATDRQGWRSSPRRAAFSIPRSWPGCRRCAPSTASPTA